MDKIRAYALAALLLCGCGSSASLSFNGKPVSTRGPWTKLSFTPSGAAYLQLSVSDDPPPRVMDAGFTVTVLFRIQSIDGLALNTWIPLGQEIVVYSFRYDCFGCMANDGGLGWNDGPLTASGRVRFSEATRSYLRGDLELRLEGKDSYNVDEGLVGIEARFDTTKQ